MTCGRARGRHHVAAACLVGATPCLVGAALAAIPRQRAILPQAPIAAEAAPTVTKRLPQKESAGSAAGWKGRQRCAAAFAARHRTAWLSRRPPPSTRLVEPRAAGRKGPLGGRPGWPAVFVETGRRVENPARRPGRDGAQPSDTEPRSGSPFPSDGG